jgi:hypothetical protein
MNGEYQGKADAASIWSVESHTFLRTHQQLTTGAFMPHVINQVLSIKKNNDAYVDDDDMTKTKADPISKHANNMSLKRPKPMPNCGMTSSSYLEQQQRITKAYGKESHSIQQHALPPSNHTSTERYI